MIAYDEARRVLTDDRYLSTELRIVGGDVVAPTASLVAMDGERHRRYRGLLDRAIRAAVTDATLGSLQVQLRSSSREGCPVDLCARLLTWLLGLPRHVAPQVGRWGEVATSGGSPLTVARAHRDLRRAVEAGEGVGYRPGSVLDAVHREPDGGPDDELFIARALASGGITTVAHALTGLSDRLAGREILGKPGPGAVVREYLRLEPPVPRTWRTGPEGEIVELDIERINRDPARFSTPTAICGHHPPGLTFGAGAHRCPGHALAAWILREWLVIAGEGFDHDPRVHGN